MSSLDLASVIDRALEPRDWDDRPDLFVPARCPRCGGSDFRCDSEWAHDDENGRWFGEFWFDCFTCHFSAENWDGTEANLMAQAAILGGITPEPPLAPSAGIEHKYEESRI